MHVPVSAAIFNRPEHNFYFRVRLNLYHGDTNILGYLYIKTNWIHSIVSTYLLGPLSSSHNNSFSHVQVKSFSGKYENLFVRISVKIGLGGCEFLCPQQQPVISVCVWLWYFLFTSTIFRIFFLHHQFSSVICVVYSTILLSITV